MQIRDVLGTFFTDDLFVDFRLWIVTLLETKQMFRFLTTPHRSACVIANSLTPLESREYSPYGEWIQLINN